MAVSDALVWRFPVARMAASTAALGGGVGLRRSVLNLQVADGYRGLDPAADLRLAAGRLGLDDPIGLMTAAEVTRVRTAASGGARAWATVGLGHPLAAARPASPASRVPTAHQAAGTINVVVVVERRLSDAGLLNLLTTATEAKCQALAEAGVEAAPGVAATGTATDALAVLARAEGPVEPFGGPRSEAGSDVARCVHRVVLEGAWNR